MNSEYFKGLNGLRAFASIFVLIEHHQFFATTNNLQIAGISLYNMLPTGHSSVVLFFVLSGFLITYLAEHEKQKYGKIDIKNFYIRRILRIFPLYFLVILVSGILSYKALTASSTILALGFLPNLGHALKLYWSGSPQIWSIGVEVQFYLILPLFLSYCPKRLIVSSLLFFIICYSIAPHAIGFLNTHFYHDDALTDTIYRYFYLTKFNCLAIGSLFGYLFVNYKDKVQTILNSRIIYFLSLLIIFLFYLNIVPIHYFQDEILAVCLALLILGITKGYFPQQFLNTKLMNFLGEYSYGIYMWHWILYTIITTILLKLKLQGLISIGLIPIVLITTIFISYLSYNFFEKLFLNRKVKFRMPKIENEF